MDRIMSFGKYKGQPIKKIILQHIGYIMWCMSNLNWFTLTEEEQKLYDALAIANVKYNIKMVFPNESMLAHVKDKDKLQRQETPFIVKGDGQIQVDMAQINDPVIKSVFHLFKLRPIKRNSLNFLPELISTANKIIETSSPEWEEIDYGDFQ